MDCLYNQENCCSSCIPAISCLDAQAKGSDFLLWFTNVELENIPASCIIDATKKRALLLYQSGQRVRDILKQLADTGTAKNYEIVKAKFQEYFEPQANRRYEVYRFRQVTHERN